MGHVYQWGSGLRGEQPQISPLRFAPVEMTKGKVVLDRDGRLSG
jgi:hypothetical protein